MVKSYISKIKLIVRVLTLILMFTFSKSWGQATIPVSRTAWATTPTGWTDNQGTSPTYGSDICSGSGAISGKLDAAGENFILFYNSSASTLTFCVKGNTGSGAFSGTFLIQESVDGSTYTAGQSVAVTTSAVSQTVNIGCNSRYVKFLFSVQTNGNIQLDNVSLTTGTCTSCTPPSTTITPVTQTVCAGSVTSFTVSDDAASSPAPSYQWQMSATAGGTYSNVVNGTPSGATYTGATTNSLSVTAGSTYFYQCLVTDNTTTCTATSGTCALVVNTAPTITLQPTDKTICSGSNTTFAVSASGSPLTYQWQEKIGAGSFTNLTNVAPYSGTTTKTLTLTNPATSLTTNQYQCIISVAGCSSATTSVANLTINTTPAIPPAPIAVANPACTTGTLAAASSTVAGVIWYWQGSVSTASVITQSTATDYTFSASNTYYVRALDASGTCWSATSSLAVTVNTAPTITLQPTDKTICSGSNTTFVVSASGSPLTYQWQVKIGAGSFTDLTNVAPYSGTTTKTLTLTNPATSLTTNQYQCIISVAGCSSVTTSVANLTINTTPAIPPAPIAVANPACTTGTLAAASSTVAGVTWYWQGSVSTASVTTQSTTTDYTFSASNTYYVRALDASGTCWSATSSLSVTVNSPITLVGPSDRSICTGVSTTFTTSGSGTNPKQWQYSSDAGATFTNVVTDAVHSGTNLATLSLTTPSVNLNGYVYRCIVSVPGCPAVTSNTALLTVNQTPVTPPTPTAAANPACSGTSLIVMTSTVAGVTWYWQGTTSAGSSTTSPTSSQYNVSASGTYYVRARTDGSSCLSASSSNIVITINQPPTITSDPVDKTQCVGTNTTFAVSATGTSLTYKWQLNTGSGFSDITASSTYSNVTASTMSITGITAGMNGYQYQCVISGASPCTSVTSNYATLVITAAGTPTLAASAPVTNAVACNAFNLSWTNGNGSNRLVVVKSGSAVTGNPVDGTSYTANTTFGSGSTIAASEYVVYKGSGSSVFISGLTASTTYYYEIFEFNGCSLNYLTSGTVPGGNETTTSCSAPAGITAVYIDACGGGCGYEGSNEQIWGTTGSYALKVATNGPTLHYSSSPTPTVTQISTYGIYSSNITALNTAVTSCTNTVFVDPNTQGYIPANSNFLIAHSCMCSPSAYDFSGLCNSGPIYVVFGNDATWPCGNSSGIFGNAGACNASPRYFDLNLAAWGVALDPVYNYDPCSLTSGSDGDIALFNPAGGAATNYMNSSCVVPLVILPIDLIDFYATKNSKKNDIVWKVASEENVVYYTIDKSNDGVNFTELASVFSKNETQGKTYSVIDETPFDDITYYRLGTKEKDGKLNYYKIISIDEKSSDWNIIHYQQEQNIIVEFKNNVPKNSVINLFDLSGKLLVEKAVKESQTTINTQAFGEGIYFLRIATPYKTENFKIIISK